ncbi:MAG: alpha/beta hydrolase [Erysipelotrichaceae bacterium]|nr:alpha/beta hydrolase [Erysipelotrichaceae bacterium]
MKKNKKTILIILVSLLIVASISCGALYYKGILRKTYKGSDEAYKILEEEHDYQIETLEDGSLCFVPNNPKAGFIFYQGGFVDHKSYSSLMDKLANNGILCILLKANFDMPLFDPNVADAKRDYFPNVSDWYIGGHSMGAYVSTEYLEKHVDDYKGLILLAGYPAKDLSNTNLKALSIYGSLDGVMNKTKYEENKKYLPRDYQEIVIEGGCHSYFGDYGLAPEDLEPTISQEEQIEQTLNAILEFIFH